MRWSPSSVHITEFSSWEGKITSDACPMSLLYLTVAFFAQEPKATHAPWSQRPSRARSCCLKALGSLDIAGTPDGPLLMIQGSFFPCWWLPWHGYFPLTGIRDSPCFPLSSQDQYPSINLFLGFCFLQNWGRSGYFSSFLLRCSSGRKHHFCFHACISFHSFNT